MLQEPLLTKGWTPRCKLSLLLNSTLVSNNLPGVEPPYLLACNLPKAIVVTTEASSRGGIIASLLHMLLDHLQ